MRRLTWQLNIGFALLGAIGLIVPAAALPCLAETCRVMPADESDCCSAGACGADRGDESPGHREGPCECPPTCPAPCGYGKVPCSTSRAIPVVDVWTPATDVVPVSDSHPVNPTGEGVFHPPRF